MEVVQFLYFVDIVFSVIGNIILWLIKNMLDL